MAKVLNPLNSVEARGKMNGLIYNSWRGISYVKAFKSPVNPKSELQQNIRSLLATLSQKWQTLTPAQRLAWRAYADTYPVLDWTGNPKRLTGLNWYLKCNIQLQRHAIATTGTPPTTPAPAAQTGFAMANNAGDLELTWTTPVSGGYAIDFFYAYSPSPGVVHTFKDCKYLTQVGANETQPYVVVAGAADGRHTIYGRVVDLSTGLVSTEQKATIAVS